MAQVEAEAVVAKVVRAAKVAVVPEAAARMAVAARMKVGSLEMDWGKGEEGWVAMEREVRDSVVMEVAEATEVSWGRAEVAKATQVDLGLAAEGSD